MPCHPRKAALDRSASPQQVHPVLPGQLPVGHYVLQMPHLSRAEAAEVQSCGCMLRFSGWLSRVSAVAGVGVVLSGAGLLFICCMSTFWAAFPYACSGRWPTCLADPQGPLQWLLVVLYWLRVLLLPQCGPSVVHACFASCFSSSRWVRWFQQLGCCGGRPL